MGIVNVLVGRRKTGKTTLSKLMIKEKPKGMPIVVYDINNEYKDVYDKPFVEFQEFLEMIKDLKGHYILIEEATIFFNGNKIAQDMTNVLVRARHTGNIIQLNFHSFNSFPRDIYNLVDFVTVFKTNDGERHLERFESPDLLSAYLQVKKDKNPYAKKTIEVI